MSKFIVSGANMKAAKFHISLVLIFSLILLANTANGRVRFSIGIGTTFGHHHGHYYHHYYPHHWWYDDCYGPWWGHSYWPGHHGSSFWFHHYSPIIIDPPPRDKARQDPPHNPKPKPPLSERMRKEQSELLRMLKIGDKENRIGAIGELAAFYYDSKARAAIEKAMLNDPDPEVRTEAATSLGRTSDRRAIDALKTAKAKDPDRNVRQAAYKSIIMIEGY